MDGAALDRTVTIASAIARAAGQMTLGSFRQPLEIRHKGVIDLVTDVDEASESLIRERLTHHFPDHALLAEEGGTFGPEDASGLWVVDPIDGTTNYAHGHPFYAVSMALVVDNELMVGVVHAPALGLTWTARRGGGTFRNGEPATVSATSSWDDALCASGFPNDRRTNPDNNLTEWGACLARAQAMRRCGSAALDLAFVADGTLDFYWEKRINSWDMAAGVLLIEEAGGTVTDEQGRAIPPWPATVVAGNKKLHSQGLELLASLGHGQPSPN
jgi:myo-inositol-1(or 4)-monophosphatase